MTNPMPSLIDATPAMLKAAYFGGLFRLDEDSMNSSLPKVEQWPQGLLASRIVSVFELALAQALVTTPTGVEVEAYAADRAGPKVLLLIRTTDRERSFVTDGWIDARAFLGDPKSWQAARPATRVQIVLGHIVEELNRVLARASLEVMAAVHEITADELAQAVVDEALNLAEAVNSDGVPEQLAYLADHVEEHNVRATIDEIVAERRTPPQR
ncbi:hypothetical protein Q5424_01120 [Conexibacter sp. JD483]|uniref:hypothetical protein n=1 Tax=unclassified Conexibacter TaxID=2627773 RepID=UPI00271C96E5|nr:MULTISPECIES: hypothetical protein [unclassified Conexibacter]MDO8185829.1 hypothetical protein [Conexibacter sp. CPCC 205706]MDO8198573.1 hypothetical protein [Conexibacter sp. CPCC 205762]MDR9367659.1 hypothetical protein [Conexibacter sp. JD483]